MSGAAYTYLKGTLRVPMFDRGLIDAFIAQETFAYIDRQAGGGAFLAQLFFWGAGLVLVGAFQLLFGRDFNWAGYWYSILGLLAVFFLIWAWPKRGVLALHRRMRDAYQVLTGSVVSVAELRRRVEFARDKGVVWPAELYALLDDVESRTKVL